jgi:dynactin-4
VAKGDRDEEMPAFAASMTWDAGRDYNRYIGTQQGPEDGRALGRIGRREENNRAFVANETDDSHITSLAQRWSSIAEQSIRSQDLQPCRMPLRTKQTKRCPTCRHIIIRPDSKPTSNRFKIRLLALNHLPEIHVRPPSTTISTNLGEDMRRSAFASMSRRKVVPVDIENLQPGRTYVFEASFLNPLDDPIAVRLDIARPPDNRYATSKYSTLDKTGASPASSKFSWTVTPTTAQFPVSAFNAVWELDEDESDLLDLTRRDDRRSDNVDAIDEEEGEGDADGDLAGDDREHKRSRTDIGGTREGRKKGHGIVRRKGHETIIGLELALSRDAKGLIEVRTSRNGAKCLFV